MVFVRFGDKILGGRRCRSKSIGTTSIIDMGHVVNDVYTSWNDVYIDKRVCRDDPISMSYDVNIDTGVVS